MKKLLEVRDLTIRFCNDAGAYTEAAKNVSFSLDEGESLAIVGESGSGKSVTALSLARLLPSPPVEYAQGDIIFDGESVAALSTENLRHLRGGKIAYIFQEPSTSLNPVYTIKSQLAEAIRLHRPDVVDVDGEIVRWLDAVGIIDPRKRMNDYPHRLSGGMMQRVMIAMALSCRPQLLIADEPTTALDVTIQAQILDLLKTLRTDYRMALILITHNFAIIRGLCDRVAVMWRGEIVEHGPTEEVLASPRHPYTQALLSCIPRLGDRRERLPTIADSLAVE